MRIRFRTPVLFPLSAMLLLPAPANASPDLPPCAQQCIQKLVPDPDPAFFGSSAAISGDTAVVGASQNVVVFVKSVGEWSQQAQLAAPANAVGFGSSVAIDEDTVIVGAPDYKGAAFAFVRNGTTWSQQAKLVPPNLVHGDVFGFTVAIRGDTALIGTLNLLNQHGAAYVFTRNGTTWTFQQKLVPQGPFPPTAAFGTGVAVSLHRAVVGGNPHSYVFVRNGSTWSQEFRVHTPFGAYENNTPCAIEGRTAVVGDKILHRSSHGWMVLADIPGGQSVDISGDTIVIGEPFEGENENGRVHVYHRDSGVWTEQVILAAPEEPPYIGFGWSVGISGCTILAGALDPHVISEGAWIFEPTLCVQ
jgi:FG-GAP repeat